MTPLAEQTEPSRPHAGLAIPSYSFIRMSLLKAVASPPDSASAGAENQEPAGLCASFDSEAERLLEPWIEAVPGDTRPLLMRAAFRARHRGFEGRNVLWSHFLLDLHGGMCRLTNFRIFKD